MLGLGLLERPIRQVKWKRPLGFSPANKVVD